MKKIAVFTSGGDSPGMNACLRAVVRTAIYHKLEVMGIVHGYDGMIKDEFIPMNESSVANIIHRGGTILKTARSTEFLTLAGQQKAMANLLKHKIDGVVVIGGDGSFKGALEFSKICSIPFVGCPGTIDNDLEGTDFTIGYDTAINTVVQSVDKVRDTAESHDRLFFVEVMGRDSGMIAMFSGIGVGAESILIPETKTNIQALVDRLKNKRKTKTSKIIIVAEGDEAGGAFAIAEQVKKQLPEYDTRVTVLGHLQRGGSPTAMDRVNSSRMGYAATEALLKGAKNVMIGIIDKNIVFTPFEKAIRKKQKMDMDLLRMMDILSI
jgi:6-phosphofructokinase 1